MTLASTLAVGACLALVPVPAFALGSGNDYWVDPATGWDGDTGQSSGDAWRTLKHAFVAAPAGATLHLLPGTYSTSSGETFPLQLQKPLTVLGEGDPEEIVIVRQNGDGVHGAIDVKVSGAVHLESFSIHGDGLRTLSGSEAKVVRVHLSGGAFGIQARDWSHVVAEECLVSDQSFIGVRAADDGHLELWESSVTGCSYAGLFLIEPYPEFNPKLEVHRCRIEDNPGYGSYFETWGGSYEISRLHVRDSIVARNGVDGLRIAGLGDIALEGCSVVENAGFGLSITPDSSEVPSIRSCAFAFNGLEDVDIYGYPNQVDLTYCLASDGSLPDGPGNLAGDPQFVDAAGGDYQLRFGSPCIDRAAPGPIGTDYLGASRSVDGDLDLAPAPDMGAFEHRTLRAPASASLGETIELLASGPEHGFVTVLVNHDGYASAGTNTPFGRLFLPLAGLYRLPSAPTLGGVPTVVPFQVPWDPALVGTSTGMQALPRSFASSSGAAFSNPVLITIEG